MPTLKFTEVITFSSEDPNHPADNLLKADTYRKWKCSAALTDKQPTVTLKLEKLSAIRALDIGNEGSAFVEVLVSREGLTNFEVLLVASSFMSPQEARNATNLNRVRMFGADKLNKNVSRQKWDRIKVVCTQPFNKNMQFGLSFITVQGGDETSTSSSSPGMKLGAFTIKPEDDESKSSISIGSIFARMKEKGTESTRTGAAAIRAAGAAAATKRKADDVNVPDVGFYQLKKKPAEDRDVPASKTTSGASTSSASKGENANGMLNSSNSKHADREKKYERESSNKEAHKKKKEDRTSRDESREKKAKKRPASPSTTPSSAGLDPAAPKKRKARPFNGLMRDVVFVMSGYQNPQRADLRDKMVEMGAKYKPDWDAKCTHLICAFTNTPKYQQVKGKGKIVSAKWIEESHKKKIRYPWRRYQLEKNRNDIESEDEIWADEIVPKSELPQEERREASTSQANLPDKSYKEDDDYYREDTDYSDNVDTDDEIERILAQQKLEKKVDDSNSRSTNSEEDENKISSTARSDRSTDSHENDYLYLEHKGESHKKKRDSHEMEESHRKTKHKNSEVKDKNHSIGKERHESKERSNSKENSRNHDSREERHKHKKKDRHGHEEKGISEKESRSKEHRSDADFDVKQEVKEEIMASVCLDERAGEESNEIEGPAKKVNGTVIKEESEEEEEEVYEQDTDVDEENKLYLKPDTSDLQLPELGDHFKSKRFFFYGEMAKEKLHLLQRYIIAFDGTLEEYMNEAVQFVITECEWDDNFDEALCDNPNLQFVKPQWIWRCSDKKKLVPHQPFLIVPKDC